MGDMTKEPSMEEILSSIKRIIAEDSDDVVQAPHASRERRIRTGRKDNEKSLTREASLEKFQKVDVLPEDEEILELTEEMPRTEKAPAKVTSAAPQPAEAAAGRPAPVPVEAPAVDAGTIVSVESELAARSSLAALSSMIVKPSDGSDNTLDGLVRELLKPMLKQWLDANLPTLVEGMVAQEISRITGRPL